MRSSLLSFRFTRLYSTFHFRNFRHITKFIDNWKDVGPNWKWHTHCITSRSLHQYWCIDQKKIYNHESQLLTCCNRFTREYGSTSSNEHLKRTFCNGYRTPSEIVSRAAETCINHTQQHPFWMVYRLAISHAHVIHCIWAAKQSNHRPWMRSCLMHTRLSRWNLQSRRCISLRCFRFFHGVLSDWCPFLAYWLAK